MTTQYHTDGTLFIKHPFPERSKIVADIFTKPYDPRPHLYRLPLYINNFKSNCEKISETIHPEYEGIASQNMPDILNKISKSLDILTHESEPFSDLFQAQWDIQREAQATESKKIVSKELKSLTFLLKSLCAAAGYKHYEHQRLHHNDIYNHHYEDVYHQCYETAKRDLCNIYYEFKNIFFLLLFAGTRLLQLSFLNGEYGEPDYDGLKASRACYNIENPNWCEFKE